MTARQTEAGERHGQPNSRTSRGSAAADRETTTQFHWESPSTWPLSVRLLPVAVILWSIFIGIYINHFRERAKGNDISLDVAGFHPE